MSVRMGCRAEARLLPAVKRARRPLPAARVTLGWLPLSQPPSIGCVAQRGRGRLKGTQGAVQGRPEEAGDDGAQAART
jgi:hypothetical protein